MKSIQIELNEKEVNILIPILKDKATDTDYALRATRGSIANHRESLIERVDVLENVLKKLGAE